MCLGKHIASAGSRSVWNVLSISPSHIRIGVSHYIYIYVDNAVHYLSMGVHI